LTELELRPQDLVLLLFEGSLSLLQSRLNFLLVNLQSSPLLVQLVNGAAAVAELIKKIPKKVKKRDLESIAMFDFLV
jgi:hypothetical protein